MAERVDFEAQLFEHGRMLLDGEAAGFAHGHLHGEQRRLAHVRLLAHLLQESLVQDPLAGAADIHHHHAGGRWSEDEPPFNHQYAAGRRHVHVLEQGAVVLGFVRVL